ncbi:unnamed protein product, partial [Mesorhabditis belari]|uniref:Uncharacterized protein n=1 Tax=Mesorhabditis belari TaxID=2138241 RepID=A0AAF3FBH6_9BILA
MDGRLDKRKSDQLFNVQKLDSSVYTIFVPPRCPLDIIMLWGVNNSTSASTEFCRGVKIRNSQRYANPIDLSFDVGKYSLHEQIYCDSFPVEYLVEVGKGSL